MNCLRQQAPAVRSFQGIQAAVPTSPQPHVLGHVRANAFFFCVSRFICMSTHPHCICLFALGTKTPSGTFCMFLFSSLKEDFEWGIFRWNKLE